MISCACPHQLTYDVGWKSAHPTRLRFSTRLSDVLAGSRRFDNSVREVIAEVRALDERWVASMSEVQRRGLSQLGWGRAERARVNFEEYFNEAAPGWAESLG